MAYKIGMEGHNDFKLAEMIEKGLLYLFSKFETSVSFFTDFMNL